MSPVPRQLDVLDQTEPLRVALRDFAELTVREALRDLPTPVEVAAVYDRLRTAWQTLGDATAEAVYRTEVRTIQQETGRSVYTGRLLTKPKGVPA